MYKQKQRCEDHKETGVQKTKYLSIDDFLKKKRKEKNQALDRRFLIGKEQSSGVFDPIRPEAPISLPARGLINNMS